MKFVRWFYPAVTVGLTAVVLAATATGSHAATSSVVQAETMRSAQGHGTVVQRDATASGNKLLRMTGDATVTKRFALGASTNQLTVRARQSGNPEGALVKITIDGEWAGQWYVKPTSWQTYTVGRTLKRGKHTLRISVLDPAPGSLYLDYTRFRFATVPGTLPREFAQSEKPSPKSSPSPTRPPAPKAPAGKKLTAFVSGYSWFDNTPPGSSDISHPVLHDKAGGTGTYSDPITVAVGHSLAGGEQTLDWPAGTRFYIPNLRRYFIVEDTCGDGGSPQDGPCHTGYPESASTWLDVWVGGENGTDGGDDDCMNAITGTWTVIKDPAKDFAVVRGDIYGSSCTNQYGNTLVRA